LVIDSMPKFTFIICVTGFFLGNLIVTIMEPDLRFSGPGSWFLLIESLSSGFFTATIITLNLDSILFPVKKKVILAAPEVHQKYRPFFITLFSAIFAMLFFLLIQMIEVGSNLFLIGENIAPIFEPDSLNVSEFFNRAIDVDGVRELGMVFFLRTILFFILSGEIITMLRRQLRDPLNTILEHLKELNNEAQVNISKIDIVNNNEFNSVYREINQLISRQQQELNSSKEQLDSIVENAADPIITFNRAGEITLFNPAAAQLLGWEQKDMLGNILFDYLTTAEEDSENEELLVYLEGSGATLKRMHALTVTDEVIPVEANFSKTENSGGVLFTLVLRDIRGQLEYEQSLTEARIAAETSNRMKSEFLANMSHELRTPLNAILGYTQLMSDDKNLTPNQQGKIKTISNSGEHLLALINDILDISKIEAGKFEINNTVFNLKSFISDLQDMFSIKCRDKGLNLYVEYIGKLPEHVLGDLGKLRQIMINLIGNAVKFTADGGIAVAVGIDDQDPGRIRFSVKDTGKGIPEKDQQSILQPFTQSSNIDHEGGTGLGLAISSRFIEMMGGSLELESKLGEGSTFSFFH
jgi:PAS domain S-box-containing protein